MKRGHGRPKQMKEINNMKTKIIGKILLSLGLVFVLNSAITQVYGGSPASPEDVQLPVVTINSTGDVTRGQTGSFVLAMKPALAFGGTYVNFSVSGTAIPGADYIALVPPATIGADGYGVILVKTLPDPRGGSISGQSYTVVVSLNSGLGYTLGQPMIAKMLIKPNCASCQ